MNTDSSPVIEGIRGEQNEVLEVNGKAMCSNPSVIL